MRDDQLEQRYKEGLSHYRAGRHEEAQSALGAVAAGDHHRAASAWLYRARSVRAHAGCGDAIRDYERLRGRHPGTSAGDDATWEQADCHRALGQTSEARRLWASLGTSERYQARSNAALAQSEDAAITGGAIASRSRGGGKKAAKAKPAAQPPAAQPPAAQPPAKQPPATGAKAQAKVAAKGAASTAPNAAPPAAGPAKKGSAAAADEANASAPGL
jgi:hypothetical protein